MAHYAYVENNSIVSLHEHLPDNWGNISNLYALKGDELALNSFGWYTIQKNETQVDLTRYTVGQTQYQFNGQSVEERVDINPIINYEYIQQAHHEAAEQDKWAAVRDARDQKMRDFEWRYVRHDRERRLGLALTDNLEQLDRHMQQLADITKTFSDPHYVVWPVWGN